MCIFDPKIPHFYPFLPPKTPFFAQFWHPVPPGGDTPFLGGSRGPPAGPPAPPARPTRSPRALQRPIFSEKNFIVFYKFDKFTN